jgi:Na+/melibiose symporter-like transporter
MEEKILKTTTKLAYGFAHNGFFMAMLLYTTFPLIFMTAALRLPFPLAVSILTWARFIDIFCSIFVGPIIEKVRLPWGKYRSWMLVSPVIAGVATCLFYSPLLLNIPSEAVRPVGILLMVIWNAFGNIVQTSNYSTNNTLITKPVDRIKMFKFSIQCQTVTGFIAGLFMMRIVFAVGGVRTINLAGMQVIGIIYSILYIAFYWFYFFSLKDYKDPQRVEKVSPLASIKLLFSSGKLATLTLAGAIATTADTFFRVLVSFLFLFVLFNPGTLDMYNWAVVIAAFLGATLVAPLAKKTSKKVAFSLGFLIKGVAFICAYFVATRTGNATATLILICVGVIGLNFGRSSMVPMFSDVADVINLDNGKFVTSLAMANYNLIFKFSGFIAAQASGILARVGFVTGVEPTAEVSQGIAQVVLLGPAAFAICGTLIMLIFYRLDEKKIPQIQALIKERDAARQQKQTAANA